MMMTSDPIADMLTRIRNANTAKHDTCPLGIGYFVSPPLCYDQRGRFQQLTENHIKTHQTQQIDLESLSAFW